MIRFRKMQTRIFAYFISLALLFPLLGIFMFSLTSTANKHSSTMELEATRAALAANLIAIVTTEQLILMEILEEGDFTDDIKIEYEAIEKQFIKEIRILKRGGLHKGTELPPLTDEKKLQLLQSLEDRFIKGISTPIAYVPNYMDSLEQKSDEGLISPDDVERLISQKDEEIDGEAEELKASIAQFEEGLLHSLSSAKESLRSIYTQSINLTILGVLLSLVIALGLGAYLSKRFMGTITKITHFAKQIGSGNLSSQIDSSQDEEEVRILTETLSTMATSISVAAHKAEAAASLLNEVQNPIIKVNSAGLITQSNSAANRLLNSGNDLAGVTIETVFSSDPTTIKQAINEQRSLEKDYELITNGQTIPTLLSIAPIAHGKEIEAAILLTDLSTTKELQKSIKIQVASSLKRAQAFETIANELTTFAGTSKEMMQGALDRTLKEDREMEEVSQLVGEVDQQLERVSTAMVQMAASIQSINDQATTTQHITEKATSAVHGIRNQVDTLGVSAENISGIVGLISEIAEQTNLLALNATIEAARAGNAGSGFAVVAKEVKALAAQTNEATREIQEKIDSINSSVFETVESVRKVDTQVSSVTENINAIAHAITEQQDTSSEVSDSVQLVATQMRSIREKALETTEASLQNSDALGQLTEDMHKIESAATSVKSESTALSDEIQRLGRDVSRF